MLITVENRLRRGRGGGRSVAPLCPHFMVTGDARERQHRMLEIFTARRYGRRGFVLGSYLLTLESGWIREGKPRFASVPRAARSLPRSDRRTRIDARGRSAR